MKTTTKLALAAAAGLALWYFMSPKKDPNTPESESWFSGWFK